MDDRHSVVCSATWQFSGACNGNDMWDQWSVAGQTSPQRPFIKPWLHDSVIVVGYELVKLKGAPDSWFMIGSGVQPDAQRWLAPNETHSLLMWPAGLGQPFPSIENARTGETEDILDLHGWCPQGDTATIMMTVYYTPAWDAETVTASKP